MVADILASLTNADAVLMQRRRDLAVVFIRTIISRVKSERLRRQCRWQARHRRFVQQRVLRDMAPSAPPPRSTRGRRRSRARLVVVKPR